MKYDILTTRQDKHYLDTSSFACALHPWGNIDSIAPNIVVGLACPDDPCSDGSMVDAHAQHEVVEGLLIDGGQHALQLQRKLYQAGQVRPPHQDTIRRLIRNNVFLKKHYSAIEVPCFK